MPPEPRQAGFVSLHPSLRLRLRYIPTRQE